MMGYGAGLGFGLGGLLVLLGCIALVVGLVVLIAWAAGRIGEPARLPQGQGPIAKADAIDVLRMRFARGEITADELTAARQTLEAQR